MSQHCHPEGGCHAETFCHPETLCHPEALCHPEVSKDCRGSRGPAGSRRLQTQVFEVPEYSVGDVARLMRRASMSASYKPALLKALARITRVSGGIGIPLESIGGEFAKMYWNQTVIFRLRQAAAYTKQAEVVRPILEAARLYGARYYGELPDAAKASLGRRMARILTINVLAAFHSSKPNDMPFIYYWSKGSSEISLTPQSLDFLKRHGSVLEALANHYWALFLESTNRLTPRIIHKLNRDGIERAQSLARYLRILQQNDAAEECFYCGTAFDGITRPTVDHVIPWSFLVDDPLWDLVAACAHCNSSKSDWLPDLRYVEKLVQRNAALVARNLQSRASALTTGEEVMRTYEAAIAADWPAYWPPQSR